MALDWRLYYADGSTFSSSDGTWRNAPPRGVVGVVHPDDRVGRQIETGDMYFWPPEAEHPWATDAWEILDYLVESGAVEADVPMAEVPISTLHEHGVYVGRSVPNAEWRELHRRMVEDPDFPPKSARYRRERTP